MEHSTEPTLPTPLPRPLSDPLRRYRWFLLFVVPTLGVAVGVGLLLPNVGRPPAWTRRAPAESASLAALFTLLLCTLRLLPRRAPNAIYLRSFRNDAATGGLRTAAQAALGPTFRLSGIRDPRRRWPALIRHLLYIPFLIRYAQPKFMNLEAGRDWKARLWRSLGEARCALIDVSEWTPFVREEVELAIGCLGFHRVLLVGDDSRTTDEWRQAVLTALGSPDVHPECFQVAIWADTPAGRAAFRDWVRAFADRVPADAPGPNAAAFPESASSADPGGNAVTGESWRTFVFANLIGVGVGGALTWAGQLTPDAGLVWFLPVAIFDALAFLLLIQYFAVCGSLRERLRIGATFLFAAAFAGLIVFADSRPPTDGVRGAAARVNARNNLHQMGLAMRQYEDTHELLPPLAVHRPDGTLPPDVGMLLLPYLENESPFGQFPFDGNRSTTATSILALEEARFGEFKIDEPQDGTQNTLLLDRTPRIYLCPSAPLQGEPTGTPYQMFTGPATVWGERNPAGQRPRIDLPGWPATTPMAVFDSPFRIADLPETGAGLDY